MSTSAYLKRLGQQRINDYYNPKPQKAEKKEVLTPKPFNPYPGAQQQVWELTEDPKDFDFSALWFCGGINSGKTFLGAGFCERRSRQDPTGRGLICANSFGQLETSTLMGLAEYCQFHNIPLEPTENSLEMTARAIANRRYCFINGVYHFVLSAEVFTGKTDKSSEAGRGLQIRWCWFDEAAYALDSAFGTIMGRLGRGPGTSRKMMLLTSSINKNNPVNWIYDKFIDEDRDEKAKQLFLTVKGRTADNPYAGEDYIETMRGTLTPELFKVELESEFVAIATDRIAYHFKRDIHEISPEIGKYNPSLPLHISFDFNNSPACAIASQLHQDEESEELVIIKEWYLENGDGTYNLSATVVDWIKYLLDNHPEEWRVFRRTRDKQVIKTKSHTVFVHGDASGKQKTANSLLSNWQIVFNAFGDRSIKTSSLVGTHNPNLVDSFNQINNVLFHKKVFVGRQCKELIKDLEVCKKDKTGAVDKTDKRRSHLFDCFRYLLWDIFPVFRAQRSDKDKVKTCG